MPTTRSPNVALLLGALLVLLLAACTDDAETGADNEVENGFVIGYSGAVQSNPNNKAVEDGLRVHAEDLGMELIVTDADLDPSKQIADVDSLLSRGIDALLIWPLDPKGIQPAMDRVREADVPIIVQDTTEGGPYATNFLVNNEEAAMEAAAFLAERVGQGAQVVSIEGIPEVQVLRARNEGFVAGAQEHGLDLVAQQMNEQDSADGARPIADAWRTRFGAELEGIFAYNDPSALGASAVVSDQFDPIIVGMNGSPEAVEAVKDGRIAATWDFQPVQLGNGMAWAAHEVLTGGELPETIHVEMARVDGENVHEWRSFDELLTGPIDVTVEEVDGREVLVVE